ncbi:hypothetical protein [Dinghuibacter silviterrae]|uniref:Uncharacterized protein n=1 Tax=Dinghuibacter silviterrae TaxID=1539049 RepID=A0A4R8DIZ6_9BACT|nr:hypothetical protein [Dinghuibacter silviterrae]TDW97294.1 hypothetical protein EDB95_5141 [Dinghuibacter silviterrae]
MNAPQLKLYTLLKNDGRLSDAKARELIEAFDELIQQHIKNASPEYQSAQKGNLLRLETNLRTEIKNINLDAGKWMIGLYIILGFAFMLLELYFKK